MIDMAQALWESPFIRLLVVLFIAAILVVWAADRSPME